MNLDVQHDRSASPLATVSDPIEPIPHRAHQDVTAPADASADPDRDEPAPEPTNTFEAFGSFS